MYKRYIFNFPNQCSSLLNQKIFFSKLKYSDLDFQLLAKVKELLMKWAIVVIISVQTPLTLLHSEWPKLHRVLAILSAIGLNIHYVASLNRKVLKLL